MRKIICDRCGAEITGERIGYIAVNWQEVKHATLMQSNPYERYDFCENCMAEIKAVIDNTQPDPESEPDPAEDPEEHAEQILQEVEQVLEEAQQEEPPKPKDKKKGVNYFKLRELVRAGLSNDQIAQELGITMKQFYYARKRAEQLYIAGQI